MFNTKELATIELHAKMVREMETLMDMGVHPVCFRDIVVWLCTHWEECIGESTFNIKLWIARDCEGYCLNNWVKFALAALDFKPKAMVYNKGTDDEKVVMPTYENIEMDSVDWCVLGMPEMTEDEALNFWLSQCTRTYTQPVLVSCKQDCPNADRCNHTFKPTCLDYANVVSDLTFMVEHPNWKL